MRKTLSWTLLLCSLSCTAYASGPLAAVSSDSLVAIVGAVLMALIAGYVRGSERRITALEIDFKQQQTQINLFRETTLDRHPNRQEFNQLREDMRQGFDEMKQLLKERRRAEH